MLQVEMTGSDCGLAFGFIHEASFRINLTVIHLIIPSTNPDNGMVEVSTIALEPEEFRFGTAIGVFLGFPILIATPFLAWIGGRDPETMLS